MNETVSIAIGALFMGLWLFAAVKVSIRYAKSRWGKVKTVKAKVVSKHILETFSKYKGNGKSYRYVVTFEIDGKKKGFYVSEFSYGGYRVNEKGTLKYRGDKIIDFH